MDFKKKIGLIVVGLAALLVAVGVLLPEEEQQVATTITEDLERSDYSITLPAGVNKANIDVVANPSNNFAYYSNGTSSKSPIHIAVAVEDSTSLANASTGVYDSVQFEVYEPYTVGGQSITYTENKLNGLKALGIEVKDIEVSKSYLFTNQTFPSEMVRADISATSLDGRELTGSYLYHFDEDDYVTYNVVILVDKEEHGVDSVFLLDIEDSIVLRD